MRTRAPVAWAKRASSCERSQRSSGSRSASTSALAAAASTASNSRRRPHRLRGRARAVSGSRPDTGGGQLLEDPVPVQSIFVDVLGLFVDFLVLDLLALFGFDLGRALVLALLAELALAILGDEEPLLVQLLAAHAVARPGLDLEALGRDLRPALRAPAVVRGRRVDAAQRLLDEQQLLLVQLGQREQELAVVAVHRVVDVVLGAVARAVAAVALGVCDRPAQLSRSSSSAA